MAYYEEQKEEDINEVVQKNEFIDYIEPVIKREQSKSKFSPRSDRNGLVNMSMAALDREQCDVDNSIVLDSSRQIKNLRNPAGGMMGMKIKDKLINKRSAQYSSTFLNRDEINASSTSIKASLLQTRQENSPRMLQKDNSKYEIQSSQPR